MEQAATRVADVWLWRVAIVLATVLSLLWAASVMPATALAEAPAGTEVYDAVVVGSGPGGLAAALSTMKELSRSKALGREGRAPRVLVVEKRGPYPEGAHAHDTRALAGSAFSRDQVISVRESVVKTLSRLGVVLPSAYTAEHQVVPWPQGVEVKGEVRKSAHALRSLFDGASTHTLPINELQRVLAEHARAAGVEMAYGRSVEALTVDAARGEVALRLESREGSAETVRARYVVGADGTRSRVRDLVGIGTTPEEKHGVMLGAWLRRSDERHELVYPDRPVRGESAVLLGTRETLYGLFALPPSLGNLLEKARAEERELTGEERALLDAHVERLSSRLLGRATKVDRISPFGINLYRAEAAASVPARTLLVGDAVQSVNPHTGTGANIAMEMGVRAGKTIAKAADATEPRVVERLFERFSKTSLAVAREIMAKGRVLKGTFAEASPAKAPAGRGLRAERREPPRHRADRRSRPRGPSDRIRPRPSPRHRPPRIR